MTKPQRPRVDLDPNIFKAIVIEATKQGKKPKDLIDQWARENVSPEVLALLDIIPLPKSTNVPINDAPLPKSTNVPTIVPLPEGDKAPFDPLPQSSELLNAEEALVLQHLRLKTPYRKIETITGVSKSKVQTIAAKLEGMGLHQRRKPPKDKV